jgi:phosphoglycolate phosphatase-like HAD superfamily hydrolase
MDAGGAAVILDVDGTLVDSNDAHARAWVDAFAEHGIAVAFERVRRAIGMGGDKLMPAVAGLDAESADGKKISQRRGEIFTERYLPTVRPFPRVRELIERFAADGFTLAVASSAQEDELTPLLEIAGVADLISTKTSSDDAENSKPDPDIVQAALKRTECDPGAAVMLGDTPYDVEAALRAGIQIAALECGGWGRAELRGAAEVHGDPADLLTRYESSIFARVRDEPAARTSA